MTDEVQRFLFEKIESYEELETLLFLHRSRGTAFTREEAAARVRIPLEAVEAALEALRRRMLVQSKENGVSKVYQYGAEAADDVSVERLACAYEQRRLDIIKKMNTNAMNRVRTAAIRTFADAFVWRKKDG